MRDLVGRLIFAGIAIAITAALFPYLIADPRPEEWFVIFAALVVVTLGDFAMHRVSRAIDERRRLEGLAALWGMKRERRESNAELMKRILAKIRVRRS